ncbi:hypothetical protein [Clostridium septicum]|uniref:Uncharacterized protein n=1 Tax=Clostridium septicum TaxID=1504 RepID=A0ABY5B3A4_CLOSE|nr:hypothetical protein [Clostridium septicum]UEC19654.1 hypothetical protein LK444_09480 [Clostridium septicum]USS02285.1 hypothetical protein NH397_07695 [Clostridium septicum]WLF70868.1 hypothetical protein Q6375_07800 [Clostridium septicum]
MSKTQKMLDEATILYELGDIVTIMLSRKRDKEIEIEQRRRYDKWKEKNSLK